MQSFCGMRRSCRRERDLARCCGKTVCQVHVLASLVAIDGNDQLRLARRRVDCLSEKAAVRVATGHLQRARAYDEPNLNLSRIAVTEGVHALFSRRT
jgi:hypothetical protein